MGQGNIFTPVCHSVHRGAGMRGCSGGCAWFYSGACVVLFGVHAWFYSGGCAWFYSGRHMWFYWGHAWFYLGACMVLFGGMHGFIWGGMCGFIRGHAWFYLGGMHGFILGMCMVLLWGHAWFYLGGMCGFIREGLAWFFQFFGYNEIRSMSRRYASYWNAFLFYYMMLVNVNLEISWHKRITF